MTNETLSANGYLGCLAMLDACSVSVRINKYPVLKCPFVSVCSRCYLQVGMVCTSLFWPGQSLQRRWHILSDLQLLLVQVNRHKHKAKIKNVHTETSSEPCCCEMTVLTTEPLCHLHTGDKYVNAWQILCHVQTERVNVFQAI